VIIGLSDRTQAEIISGLAEGDKILLPTPEAKPQNSNAPRMPPGGGMGRL
jgi:hypothetical protein